MTRIERLQETGIHRVGSWRNGFRYRRRDGKKASKEDLGRIRSLVLPPRWRDVAISASPSAPVQAIGRDKAGRWQYRYSAKHARLREKRKTQRLLKLLSALPQVRSRISRDLQGTELTRERILATMVRILLRGFLRPGSEIYARDNGTYGLATLQSRHVSVTGGQLSLKYPGKRKKIQVRQIRDAAAASVVAELLRIRGARVFRFPGADGTWENIRRRHLNEYIREIAGERFTAKDFRTWAGTLFGACSLAHQTLPEPLSRASVRKSIRAAMVETSTLLGNTPAVCRASYVCPEVLTAFEKGHRLRKTPKLATIVRGSSRLLESTERQLALLISRENGQRMSL